MVDRALEAADGQSAELVESNVFREHGYLSMRDNIRVAYVVWRPAEDGKFPVLLQYSVYGDAGMAFAEAKPYLKAGYAVIGATVRGTGASEGDDFQPYRPTEGPDGAQIVEWAGVQPWSTGNVGVIGNSNPGIMGLLVAAEKPKHLKAIAIAGIMTSGYRDVYMPGGMFQYSYAGEWSLGGQESSARGGALRRIHEWGDLEAGEIVNRHKPYRLFWEMQKHPLQDEWWETVVGKEKAIPLAEIPTMLMGGFQDEYTNAAGAAARAFAHLLPDTTPKKLLLTNGGHGAAELAPVLKEKLRWLDHWLKGIDNGIDDEPPVTIFWETQVEGSDFAECFDLSPDQFALAKPSWVTKYAKWPPSNSTPTTFFLSEEGELDPIPPPPHPSDRPRQYLYPSGTELVGSQVQFGPQPQPTGSLHYRTAPLIEDMVVLGNPEIDFYFSSDQADLDFMVTLKDVDEEGNSLYLTRGFLRASLREIDPSRSWPDEINQSFRVVRNLDPGTPYQIRFSLRTIGHVLRTGHRLEASILAPNDIPAPVFASTPIGAPSVVTVFHSEKFPSKLVLPVLSGERARGPVPALGALWFQPYRRWTSRQDDWIGGLRR